MRSQFRLASLIAACALPLCVAIGIQAYARYEARSASAREDLLVEARELALMVDREFGHIQGALQTLAGSRAFPEGDFASLYRQTAEVLKSFPGGDVIVADRAGQQVMNSYLALGAPLPRRNVREAVEAVFRDGQPQISSQFHGAVTNRQLVSIDVPVRVGDEVLYDLAITIPSEYLGKAVHQQHLPGQWIQGLVDGNGAMVMRTPEGAADTDRQAGAELRRAIAAGVDATFEDVTPDGARIVTAYSRSTISGWGAVVSTRVGDLESRLRRWLWPPLAGLLLSALAAVALATVIARQIVQANTALEERTAQLSREVTERREAEQRVRESEELLRGVLKAAPFPMLVSRFPDGRMLFLNQPAADLLGIAADLSADRLTSEFYTMEGEREQLLAILAAGQAVTGREVEFRRQDGSLRWVLMSAVRFLYGHEDANLVCMNDISARKELERTLRRAKEQSEAESREQRQFLSMVSHEFRTPLGIIANSASLLSDFPGDEKATTARLGKIQAAVRRMALLIDTLLMDDWLASERTVLRLEEIDLRQLISEVIESRQEAERRRITVFDRSAAMITGDRPLLRMAIGNLVDNSLKYAAAETRVEIELAAEGSTVVVKVADRGPGIAPDDAERVFEKFYRGPGALRQPGSGLGLFLVRQIISRHHGSVTCTPRPDGGTVFHLGLPAN